MPGLEIDEHTVPLASEDRFLVVAIRQAEHLCPSYEDGEALGTAVHLAKSALGNITPVFDLRGLPMLYEDVGWFIQGMGGNRPHVLVPPVYDAWLDPLGLRRRGCVIIPARGAPYRATPLHLSPLVADVDAAITDPAGIGGFDARLVWEHYTCQLGNAYPRPAANLGQWDTAVFEVDDVLAVEDASPQAQVHEAALKRIDFEEIAHFCRSNSSAVCNVGVG